MKKKTAPPIPPEYLVQQEEYYEDLKNLHCLKVNKGIVCFCSDRSECVLFDECVVANTARKAMNIKLV